MTQTHYGPWHLAEVPSISTTTRRVAWRRYVYNAVGNIVAVQWQD
jgi:hypothetical protein